MMAIPSSTASRAAPAMAYRPVDYWGDLHRREAGKLTAVGYDTMGEWFNRITYRKRLATANRLLRRTVEPFPPSCVLEAGVGVGAYARLWSALGITRWVGVDISPDAIEALRRRFPRHAFHTIDLACREWSAWKPIREAGPYEVVTAIDVLYHLTDDAQWSTALRNLASLVRVGGTLALSDVFVAAPHQRAGHVRRRPLAAYAQILGEAGLTLVRREPVFAVLGDPVSRPGLHPIEAFMSATWRVLQKTLRTSPAVLREPLGAVVAGVLWPLDALLCRARLTNGVNLELAAFRRVS